MKVNKVKMVVCLMATLIMIGGSASGCTSEVENEPANEAASVNEVDAGGEFDNAKISEDDVKEIEGMSTSGNYCYSIGFAKEAIPVDLETETYYVAGYKNDMKATGQLDPQMVRALVIEVHSLEDQETESSNAGGNESKGSTGKGSTGKGSTGNGSTGSGSTGKESTGKGSTGIESTGKGPIVLISVDCVALSSADVERIRDELKEFTRKTGCQGIHIMSTHDHAGADTLGLWGPVGIDGKNEKFMQDLRDRCVQAVEKAYENRRDGDLYFGYRDTTDTIPDAPEDVPFISFDLQEDTRKPYVFDSNIYSFRFVPYDEGSQVLRIVNYASHAESLDGDNSLLSADFPSYAAKELAERENSELIWFPGAIGGLMRTRFMLADRVKNCELTGRIVAEHILAIDNEVKLEPTLRIDTVSVEVPCENPLFLAMKFLGVLESRATVRGGDVFLCSEVSLLQVGGKKILLVPGEIFPELVYGNDTDFKGNFPKEEYPEKNIDSLCDVLGDDLLIFGLADDEVGYIVPPSDFLLSETNPYLDRTRDKYGEDHYEETNSCGPKTAEAILEAVRKLKELSE